MRRFYDYIKLGVVLGVILGTFSAWHAGQFQLDGEHYRTAFQLPIQTIDSWALTLPILLCAALAIFMIARNLRLIPSALEDRGEPSSKALWVSVPERIARLLGHGAIFAPLFLLLLAANFTARLFTIQERAIIKSRPDVIFIMVDTLRADHLSCYGYSKKTTPNLDKFASEALLFKRAVSQAPATKWSVPSFLTSEYPQDRYSNYGLNLPTVLKNYGYTTAGVISNLQVDNLPGVAGGWDFWDTKAGWTFTSSPMVVDNALAWLSKLPEERDHPFFLFTLFIDPHSPYDKHDGFDFDSNYNGPAKKSLTMPAVSEQQRVGAPCGVEHVKALYDSEVAFTDAHIGRFIRELKKKGLYDKSLIVFLADHGEEFMDHGDYFHAKTLYNEVLSVPVIIKLPNQHEGRIVDGGAFRLIDLAPSVLKSVGINPEAIRPQGTAINLRDVTRLEDKPILSATLPHLRSIQDSRYEFIEGTTIYTKNKPVAELYDLRNDPKQHHNLFPGHADLVANFRQLISANDKIVADDIDHLKNGHEARPEAREKTAEENERLKSLGYLGK